ncbi:MAG TPA: sodium:proton antiporter [Bacteroidia bacterium]|jgi:CPA1 family monovalent cation:H+ antiporter|nr:sodium:proton antiporter [Bacteroidia bacterium]
MNTLLLLTIIITTYAALAFINQRFLKLPSSIGLMLISLILSLIVISVGTYNHTFHLFVGKVVQGVDFSKTLLNVMLGFLLFSGSLHIDLEQLRKQYIAVVSFSTLSVALSTFFFGGLMWFVFRVFNDPVEFIYCLWFGALLSPTDPIAVLGILKKSNIPQAIKTTINGESLFNDGIGIVFFVTIGSVAQYGLNSIDFLSVAQLFLTQVIGGLLFGVALAYVALYFIRKIDDYQTEIVISLAFVMMSGMMASYLDVSGPLAVIILGLALGNKSGKMAMSGESRDYFYKFWDLVDSFLNGILFVLMGLQMVLMPFLYNYIIIGVVAIILLLLCRYISLRLPMLFIRNKELYNRKTALLMTWGGLRGGLSLALTLSLPENPYKKILVSSSYLIVIFSILVQGLTTDKLVKRLYR